MKKLFIAFTIILYSLIMNAQSLPKQPDFAFPKKVKSEAIADYHKALQENDGDRIINSLVAYELAVASIDRDSVLQPLNLIAKTASMTDASTSAILNILLADIYADIYTSARYKYDRRELPDNDMPEDFQLWSGDQFKLKINSLIDSALISPETLKVTKLAKYPRAITADSKTLDFYPTVYDFVATKAIMLLNRMSPMQHDFSVNLLCRYDFYTKLSFNYQDPTAQRILNLYRDLLVFHENETAPFIITDINRINFISGNVFQDGDPEPKESKREELLYALYDRYKSSPFSGEALIELDRPESTDTVAIKKYFDTLTGYVSAHPGYFRINCIKNSLAAVTNPYIELSFPRTIVPGQEMKITVKAFNTAKYELLVYKVPYSSYSAKVKGGTPMKRVQHSINRKAPFFCTHEESLILEQPGTYAIVPVINGIPDLSRHYEVTQCTNLTAATATFAGKTWGYAVNPFSGAPLGQNVEFIITGNRNTVAGKLPVKADGITPITVKGNFMYATSGNDRSDNAYILNSSPVSTKPAYSVTAFTDLAIYHPGDTVQWSAVLQRSMNKSVEAVPSVEIEATLRSANYELIDTVTCTTDEFGRAKGSFKIPDEGLTGYYSIQFRHIDSNGKPSTYGSKNFMVSDYKLPTYTVEITDVRRDYPSKGDVTIDGTAKSYSGFPLGDCGVAVNLSGIKYSWWMRSMQKSFYSTETSTSADGKFSVTFPSELLASSPIEGGIYEAEFIATSPSGENRSATRVFSLGTPYLLNASIPKNIDASKPFRFAVELTDLMSKPVNKPVIYSITKGNDTIASGRVNDKALTVDLDDVPSGTYDITFSTLDPSLAKPYTAKGINIYRPGDALPPATEEPIWLPENRYVISSRKVSILYGTRADVCHILCAISTPDSLLEQHWIEVKPGMHHFDYELPDGVDEATITLYSVNNYLTSSHSVNVIRDESIKQINLSIESFRDKIVPGEKERWTLKVTDRSGNGTRAAIMLDMYCKALDELLPYSMQLQRMQPGRNMFRISTSSNFGNTESYFSAKSPRYLKCKNLLSPEIQHWNRPYYLEEILTTVRTTSARLYAAGASDMMYKKAAVNGMLKEEAADDAVEMEAEAPMADAGAAAREQSNDNFQYRPAEIPLAFFEPSLVTGNDGTLEFSFTAPNANTTWQLCALAFTHDVVTSSLSREIISSKPVMVQPNLPRFLHAGDKAIISAMVMNNSDIDQTVKTTVEIFEPVTGTIINTFDYSDSIAAGESTTINTNVSAPTNGAMLGYRIKSSIPNFADGEQSILPILPSIAPVIDAKTFYIPATEKDFELKLPEIAKDAAMTLQYCNNPIWYVVTALPGLRNDNNTDALSQSAAIFSAAIAEGIVSTDKEIAAALKEWSDNPSDSTLTSMLNKNSDLKTMLLNATPWSMDAKSQTERMARLALLFDKSEIESTYSSAIKRLSSLECAGGGWAWTEHYKEPSHWITLNILGNLGKARHLGFGPKDAKLSNMETRAIGYLDREAAKTLKNNPKATGLEYLIVRDYYPSIHVPSSAQGIISNTIADVRKEWKNYNAPMKAIAAIVMYNHNEKAIAQSIISSLREYAVTSPEKGMWWPSLDNMTAWSMGKISATSLILDAFSTVDPASAEIDLIRQWLILQKEAKDWGTSVSTSDAIFSILSCGSSWVKKSGMPQMKIGRKQIKLTDTDSRLGYVRTDISELHPSKNTLSVSSHDSIPSWGAIFIQYDSEISEIKAAGCDDVSINKQLFKRVIDPTGEKWTEADTMTVGDVIQVNITIETKRDMDYVVITDDRGACFEPVEQLPAPIFSEGICFYRENRDASTNIFVDHLPKGVYRLSYELNVNNAGRYSAGVATLQSQYAPAMTAHSAGSIITVGR
ncbi:MAG: MG2 domain-containing protein [Lachnospiraceae bacterium]|nr:MG2 domain-containing protein [Lachnospiraceae bacterium]